MASENESENRETVDNVLAEYREDVEKMDRGGLYQPTTEYVRRLLDRTEAAWKREKAEWEAAACAFVSDVVMSGKVAVEHSSVGNAAAMREALEKIVLAAKVYTEAPDDQYPAVVSGLAATVCKKARDALSAPARNCDMLKTGKDAKYMFLQIAELPEGNGDADMREWYRKLIEWLFEPAKKGEIDGSK